MSDNIFNYFSSKGTRKVAPIDDAEFNSIDAPAPPIDPPSQSANSDSTQSPVVEGAAEVTAAPRSVQDSSSLDCKSPPSEVASTKEPVKKTQSNWDYLASMLGIKKDPPVVADEEKRTPAAGEKLEKPATVKPENIKPAIVNPFGSMPKEIAKEEVILSSLFVPTGEAVDSFDEPELSNDDSEIEYVEFEVEDLDKTAGEDETDRKPRRSFSRSNESRSRSNQPRPSGERERHSNPPRHDATRDSDGSRKPAAVEPQSRDRQVRGPQERQDRESSKRESSNRESSNRESSNRESSNRESHNRDHQNRGSHGRDRQDREALNPTGRNQREFVPESEFPAEEQIAPRRDRRPERDDARRAAEAPAVDRSFGSGIFDESPERSEPSSNERAPRRKRRRRRGRDASATESAPASLPRHSPLPDVDPPDEFFDEIGWQPAHAKRQNRPESLNDLNEDDDFESSLDEDADYPAANEGESGSGDRTSRKRRRRRPRGRRDSAELEVADSVDNSFENRPAPARERLEDDQDEFDYDQAHRNPRQPRQPASSARNHDRNSDDDPRSTDDELPKRDRKFPTWEEAISVLVESNMKNHSRSPGQHRSGGNRGRRRR